MGRAQRLECEAQVVGARRSSHRAHLTPGKHSSRRILSLGKPRLDRVRRVAATQSAIPKDLIPNA
jgi:hypothetical protein